MTEGTGIFGLTAELYHADPCEQPSLSSSIAHILCTKSPRHARTAHPRLNLAFEREEFQKFDVGTVAHAILLEGRDIVSVIDAPDWRTKAAKEAREEARAIGKVPLLADQLANVEAMVEAAQTQLARIHVDPPLFADGKPEQTLVWKEGDVTCRALLDWLRDDYSCVDDFKTTSASADPHRWTRTLFTIGADIQVVFYLRGLKAITGAEALMRFVVQETYPPYALSVVSLGPDVLAVAESKVEYAVRCWRECMASGEWPGYSTEVCYAELPPWEESRWFEREAVEAA